MLALILLIFSIYKEDMFDLRLLISSTYGKDILLISLALFCILNSSLGDVYNNWKFCDSTCSAHVGSSL